MSFIPDVTPMHQPEAELERQLIEEYLRSHGHDPDALRSRMDVESHQVLAEASNHASQRLAQLECRYHYIHDLSGSH
jgi:hypothetical protein